MGLADVAAGDIFNDFDRWQDEILWPAIGGGQNNAQDESGPEVEIDTTSRRSNLRQDVKEAIVISNQVLTAEGVPEKRHIVLQLPTGMTYKAGDYLAVLPINNRKYIHRVLKRFGLPWDAMLNIKSGANTTLPTGHPMSAISILGAYVELSQLATRKVRNFGLTLHNSSSMTAMLICCRISKGSVSALTTRQSAKSCEVSLERSMILKWPQSGAHLLTFLKNTLRPLFHSVTSWPCYRRCVSGNTQSHLRHLPILQSPPSPGQSSTHPPK